MLSTQLSMPPRSASRVEGGAWAAATPDEAEGLLRFGVEGSREGRSLRLVDEVEEVEGRVDGSSGVEEAREESSGVVEVEAASGEGELSPGEAELRLMRRMPDSCRLSAASPTFYHHT